MKEMGFEANYNTRHQLLVKGGQVEAIDLKPNNLTTATPILLAPGWSETIEVNRVVLEELFNSGRRVVTLNHARKGIAVESELPKAVDRKSASLLALLEYFDLDKVDIIAHSEGGLNATIAALKVPEKIRNLILIGSSGLLLKDNLLKLALRFTNEGLGMALGSGKTQTEAQPLLDTVTNISRYVLSNPVWSLQEVDSIANQYIIGDLRELQNKGVGISIIYNVDDRVFPIALFERAALATLMDKEKLGGFYSVIGNHNAVLGDRRVIRLAVSAIDNLEAKRAFLTRNQYPLIVDN